MHERELYDRLLGLSAPWFVADVNLDTEAQQVQGNRIFLTGEKYRSE